MLFWTAITFECIAMLYFLLQASRVRSKYVAEAYYDAYMETLFPAAVLFVIVSAALIARLFFKRDVVAFYIALSPAVLMVVAGIVWLVVVSVRRDTWR